MTSTPFDPGPAGDAEAVEADGRWTLVLRRRLRHPRPVVWSELTDPAQLAAWAPYTADRDLGHTGETVLSMVDGSTTVDLPAQVVRAEPPLLLEHSWGDDLLRWELEEDGAATLLTLRHTVGSKDWLARAAAGWHLCLAVAGRFLDGVPVGPIVGEAARAHGWDELRDAYAAQLGAPDDDWPQEFVEGR